MQKSQVIGLAFTASILSGCATAFVPSSVNTTNLESVNFADVETMRRGESCATTILGLFTQGDALVTDAAANGGISQVEIVEHKLSANLLFSQQCVIVFGR